jgi:hypothetical protein
MAVQEAPPVFVFLHSFLIDLVSEPQQVNVTHFAVRVHIFGVGFAIASFVAASHCSPVFSN